jgi:phosphatidylserine decarboxylase
MPCHKMLNFLYTTTTGKLLRKIFHTHWLAKCVARYMNSRLSRKHIQPFIKEHRISMGEYLVPTGGYSSFNDFFIRKIKPSARSIDRHPNHIISPVDGNLCVIPHIETDTIFYIKQQAFNLERFLKDAALTRTFADGVMMIFRLSPHDYHRIHFPIDCSPQQPRIIQGQLESVNPAAFGNDANPLLDNERHLIMLETTSNGPIAMIPVGAMMVGSIMATYTPGKNYRKGDECGYFALGGSTVVLLFSCNSISPITHFVERSLQGLETAVKMGVVVTT